MSEAKPTTHSIRIVASEPDDRPTPEDLAYGVWFNATNIYSVVSSPDFATVMKRVMAMNP